MIRMVDKKYYIYSEDGSKKLGGPYYSKAAAERRLQVIEYFKHKGKK
jgi:hypothetical protein